MIPQDANKIDTLNDLLEDKFEMKGVGDPLALDLFELAI